MSADLWTRLYGPAVYAPPPQQQHWLAYRTTSRRDEDPPVDDGGEVDVDIGGTVLPVNFHNLVVSIACIAAFFSCLLALHLCYKHLRNYTKPSLQRPIIRIIWMVPIYSVCSCLSLIWIEWAKYFDLARDCYESYLLYQFFTLILNFINVFEEEHENDKPKAKRTDKSKHDTTRRGRDGYYDEDGMETDSEDEEIAEAREKTPLKYYYVGEHKVWIGEERVVRVLKSKPPMGIADGCPVPHGPFPKFGTGRTFLRWTKRMMLQFVVLKPIIAVTVVILEHYHLFHEGNFSPRGAYLYITLIENASITTAMYFLVLFYHAVTDELAPFKPIPKFLCIKAIIMFAFWQSVIIAVLVRYHILRAFAGYTVDEIATGLNDFLICLEMFLISVSHVYIFGHDSYRNANKESFFRAPHRGILPILANFADALDQRDILRDAKQALTPGHSRGQYVHQES